MAKCKYCGEGAGWFRSQHKECAAAHTLAVDGIATAVRNGLVNGLDAAALRPEVDAHTAQGRVVTTKHLYYGSAMTSFKIPFAKIVAIQSFSDGIQIQKDGIRSRPQVFKGVDAWFVSNVISSLAP